FLLIALFLSFQTLTAVQLENLQIESIDIVGIVPEGTTFDPKPVLSHMKTRQGDFFSQSTFDNDLKTLALEFDKVEPSFEVVNGKIVMTLKVWPKPHIRSIKWEGNSGICTDDLVKELGISICTVFDRIAFNKAFHKLKAYY